MADLQEGIASSARVSKTSDDPLRVAGLALGDHKRSLPDNGTNEHPPVPWISSGVVGSGRQGGAASTACRCVAPPTRLSGYLRVAAQRIVVIGASSGGIEALRTIAAGLPASFAAPLCVVVHISPDSPALLDGILSRVGPLEAVVPDEPTVRLQPGRIYVARPDHHLLVEPGLLRLTKGPRENRFRPAIDPLFRSAARVYGPGAIGVVLTGNLDDGAAGLWTIKRLGGTAIVQDPQEAQFPSMPESALSAVDADYVVGIGAIAPLLVRLLEDTAERPLKPDTDGTAVELTIATGGNALEAGVERLGEPSSFACPECHGVLIRLKADGPVRFRCHTGHAYSALSLAAAIDDAIEDALWNAVRAIEEGSLFLRHLSTHSPATGSGTGEPDFADQADAAHRHAEAVREVAHRRGALRVAPLARGRG